MNQAFDAFFGQACATAQGAPMAPYPYQQRLAAQPWPDGLDVPTGLGKTAAITLAWLYKRGWRAGAREGAADVQTPRRLIWCLPMRVLVEQTRDTVTQWLERLGIVGKAGQGKVSVHVLMGGEDDLRTWAEHPEEDMILIGTQDMLLSRALMRGYGMSPYQWPIHFALLHNDALWVFDEVQLMGTGLTTSAQLEAFRREFALGKNSRSLWVSATFNPDWLATVDLAAYLPQFNIARIDDADRAQAQHKLQSAKAVQRAPLALTVANKAGVQDYLKKLAEHVLAQHNPGSQTLVIVNNVQRAQQLFALLQKQRPQIRDLLPTGDLLIHARFRPAERARQAQQLRDASQGVDRIIVATQAIEAGVDVSSQLLITELAPWPSLVQRFGRCNRYGEHNATGARVEWIDLGDDKTLVLPYSAEALEQARAKLKTLTSASPQNLPKTDEVRPATVTLRRCDLTDFFNTDQDLSGFEADVSHFVRDSGAPGVQVFWRDFAEDPNQPEQPRPARDELCPASMGQINGFARRKDVTLWQWNHLTGQWAPLRRDRDIRPGLVLLARARDGGYSPMLGFDGAPSKTPVPVLAEQGAAADHDFADDWRSQQNRPVALSAHLGHVAAHAKSLCEAVGENAHAAAVIRAGRWHDLGKAHRVFDETMHACGGAPAGFLAKSSCKARHSRPFFRHELASMLGWLAQHDGEADADLIAYLILAHHGKVRMSLRAMPNEHQHVEPGIKRFARGVWEGDPLPALSFDGEQSAALTLNLAMMEMGLGEQGPSWRDRTEQLLAEIGPFQLAWLETLVRLADWRASAQEQRDDAALSSPSSSSSSLGAIA